MRSLSHPIKPVKDSAVREVLPGLLLSFAITASSKLLAIYLPRLGGVAITILLGTLLRNTFSRQPVLAIDTKFAGSKLLEFSISLLGAAVITQTIAQIGIKGIVFVLLQMSVTIIGIYLIGEKLQFSGTSSLMIAGGSAVCGSSAIASIAPSIHAKEEEKGQVITLVNLLGTAMVLTLPFLGLQLFDGNLIEKSALLGGTLQSVGQVVAGTSLLNNSAVEFAMLFKILRIMVLVVVIYLFEKFMHRKQPALFETLTDMQRKRKLLLPWYVLGFMVFCSVNSLFSSPVVIDQSAHFISSQFKITALTAVGLCLGLAKFMKEDTRFLLYGLVIGLFQTVMTLPFIRLIKVQNEHEKTVVILAWDNIRIATVFNSTDVLLTTAIGVWFQPRLLRFPCILSVFHFARSLDDKK